MSHPARPPACPAPAALMAFAVAALPDDLARDVALHLESCPACRRLAADLAQLDPPAPSPADLASLRARVHAQLPKPRRNPFAWLWLAAPAAAAAALFFLLFPTQPHPAPPPLLAAAIPAPSFPIPTPATPPVRLPVADLLVWRGAAPQPVPPALRAFAAALTPYRNRQWAASLASLQPFTNGPYRAEASFYLAASLLQLDRPADATAPLSLALDSSDPAIQSDAAWLLALAHLRLARVAHARPLLLSLCRTAGPHAPPSCALLASWSNPVPSR